jgi:hypothetical protein
MDVWKNKKTFNQIYISADIFMVYKFKNYKGSKEI